MSGLGTYLAALGLTLLLELPVYVVALRASGVPPRRALAAGVVANLLTHPLLWFALRPWTGGPGYAVAFLAGEALVCAVETAVLRIALRRHAVGTGRLAAVSVGANAVSAAAGLVVALVVALRA